MLVLHVAARVIAIEAPKGDFDGAIGDAVEEVAVMRYHNQRTVPLLEEALQPFEGGQVEVVGGFVEEQNIGARQQDGGQGGAGFHPSRELSQAQRPMVGWVKPQAFEDAGNGALDIVATGVLKARQQLAITIHAFTPLGVRGIGDGDFELADFGAHVVEALECFITQPA